MSAHKIVSLLPAATEIVCALGLESSLVGRSHECDYPESVKSLPVCSEANFPDGLSSADIDVKVKEILAEALSVYTVKARGDQRAATRCGDHPGAVRGLRGILTRS
jgi:iron complex transport system substrate-binding protein